MTLVIAIGKKGAATRCIEEYYRRFLSSSMDYPSVPERRIAIEGVQQIHVVWAKHLGAHN